MKETIGDLAGMGTLEGHRVRFLADDIPTWCPKGTIGTVLCVSVNRWSAAATVEYVREDLHEGHPFRKVVIESKLYRLELAD